MTDRRHDPRQRSRTLRGRSQYRLPRADQPRPAAQPPETRYELITVYSFLGPEPVALVTGTGHYSNHQRSKMGTVRQAKFQIGDMVRHRIFPFRGVIFDVDPVFANTEEWWLAIPEEIRPRKDQPFYHLLAENEETTYVAYVSEQNLLPDESGRPSKHPDVGELFEGLENGRYMPRARAAN
jgi:heat shock protein HspQ